MTDNNTKPLPVTLIILTVFILGSGALAVLTSYDSIFTIPDLLVNNELKLENWKQNSDKLIDGIFNFDNSVQREDEYDDFIKDLPKDQQEQIKSWLGDKNLNQMMKQQFKQLESQGLEKGFSDKLKDYLKTEEGLSMIVEVYDFTRKYYLFKLLGFFLGLMALTAGIAVLARKNWGRILTIWFVILATIITSVAGFMFSDFFFSILDALEQLAPMPYFNADEFKILFTRSWIFLTLLFAVMHGLIVLYLMKKNVKEVFFDIEAEAK